MEPTNKPSLISRLRFGRSANSAVDFLPDADEIEQRPLPFSARITLHVLASALLAAILIAYFSQIDLVVSATGRTITPLPNIVLHSLDTAIVQRIEVRTGQIVKKGEGAYYSSGSRPNQTAKSWGLARLASSLTAGKAAAIDYDIIEKGGMEIPIDRNYESISEPNKVARIKNKLIQLAKLI